MNERARGVITHDTLPLIRVRCGLPPQEDASRKSSEGSLSASAPAAGPRTAFAKPQPGGTGLGVFPASYEQARISTTPASSAIPIYLHHSPYMLCILLTLPQQCAMCNMLFGFFVCIPITPPARHPPFSLSAIVVVPFGESNK